MTTLARPTVPSAEPPTGEPPLGAFVRLATHAVDTRLTPPDLFRDVSATDWTTLRWGQVKRPHTVEKWSEDKLEWEREHGQPLPVLEGWKRFNRNFHELFSTDVPAAQARARGELTAALTSFDLRGARAAVAELLQLAVWNKVHRVEDAVWDPRGKRALF